jgi:hypothetical protein
MNKRGPTIRRYFHHCGVKENQKRARLKEKFLVMKVSAKIFDRIVPGVTFTNAQSNDNPPQREYNSAQRSTVRAVMKLLAKFSEFYDPADDRQILVPTKFRLLRKP